MQLLSLAGATNDEQVVWVEATSAVAVTPSHVLSIASVVQFTTAGKVAADAPATSARKRAMRSMSAVRVRARGRLCDAVPPPRVRHAFLKTC